MRLLNRDVRYIDFLLLLSACLDGRYLALADTDGLLTLVHLEEEFLNFVVIVGSQLNILSLLRSPILCSLTKEPLTPLHCALPSSPRSACLVCPMRTVLARLPQPTLVDTVSVTPFTVLVLVLVLVRVLLNRLELAPLGATGVIGVILPFLQTALDHQALLMTSALEPGLGELVRHEGQQLVVLRLLALVKDRALLPKVGGPLLEPALAGWAFGVEPLADECPPHFLDLLAIDLRLFLNHFLIHRNVLPIVLFPLILLVLDESLNDFLGVHDILELALVIDKEPQIHRSAVLRHPSLQIRDNSII